MKEMILRYKWQIILVIAVLILGRVYTPVTLPAITIKPEELFRLGSLDVTNSMVTLWIAEALLLFTMVMVVRRFKDEPGIVQSVFEYIINFFDEEAVRNVGETWAKKLTPIILTVFLIIFAGNMLHFLPGFDTVGMIHCHQDGEFQMRWIGTTSTSLGLVDGEAEGTKGCDLVPYLRVPGSDLNFTIALAIIGVALVEYVGFKTHGIRYLTKFFHIDFSHGVGNGVLNFFIGIIELISEGARIISFSFRLFGNVFAGAILLLVFMFLTPYFLVVPFYGLEIFIGIIQAYIFAELVLVFAGMAVEPLHGGERKVDG